MYEWNHCNHRNKPDRTLNSKRITVLLPSIQRGSELMKMFSAWQLLLLAVISVEAPNWDLGTVQGLSILSTCLFIHGQAEWTWMKLSLKGNPKLFNSELFQNQFQNYKPFVPDTRDSYQPLCLTAFTPTQPPSTQSSLRGFSMPGNKYTDPDSSHWITI